MLDRTRTPRGALIAIVLIGGMAIGLAATAGATPGASPAPVVTGPTTPTTAAAPAEVTTTTAPLMVNPAQPIRVPIAPVPATPTKPLHDARPQEAPGETAADTVTIADDGFGNPVSTGAAEVRRLGQPYDTSDLADVCVAKPWLCDDSFAH
jgi:hypothetical protein